MLIDRSNYPKFLAWLKRQAVVAVDTETNGLDPYGKTQNRICGLALYANGEGWYLPVRHGDNARRQAGNLPVSYLTETLDTLWHRCVNDGVRLLMWHAKFDLHMMHADGFGVVYAGHPVEDYMLAVHLLNENEPSFGLKEIADKYGICQGSKDERELREVIERECGVRTLDKSWKGELWRLSASTVEPYAVTDVVLTWEVAKMAASALKSWKLDKLFEEVNAYNLILWGMENRGVQLDIPAIQEHMRTSAPKLAETEREIRKLIAGPLREAQANCRMPTPVTGKSGKLLKIKTSDIPLPLRLTPNTFNPGSPGQLMAIFPQWLRTDVAFLETLRPGHPDYKIAQAILDWRVLSKMNGTYYDAYLALVDASGVLRPGYNVHGTVSGRLSGSKPNLQNVPRYTPRRPVKYVFQARPGFVLVEVDYQQAELRIAAHYAKCPRMTDILESGRDAHQETADGIGIERHAGKTLNFSVLYGGGAPTVSKQLKCPIPVARDYLSGFHGLYPEFQWLSSALQDEAEQRGFIRMESGRICHFRNVVTGEAYRDRRGFPVESRKAMNRLIQGTAAEMLRVAMGRLDERIRRERIEAYMLLQVHDSLITEVKLSDLDCFLAILRPEMCDFGFRPAPDISLKVGERWGELKEIQL